MSIYYVQHTSNLIHCRYYTHFNVYRTLQILLTKYVLSVIRIKDQCRSMERVAGSKEPDRVTAQRSLISVIAQRSSSKEPDNCDGSKEELKEA